MQECFCDSISTVETDLYAVGMTLYRIINNINDWRAFTQSITDFNNMCISGKLIDVLPYHNFIPKKIIKIIQKACHKDPKKRFKSATEMRDCIQKIKPNINWQNVNKHKWIAKGEDNKIKYEASIEQRKNGFEFVFKNNGRRDNKICKCFGSLQETIDCLHDYINKTTIT